MYEPGAAEVAGALVATPAAVLEATGAAADDEVTGVADPEEAPSHTAGPGIVYEVYDP